MMMAGLDGIANRIHPGDPMDKNLYDLPPEELKDIADSLRLPALRDSLNALSDRTASSCWPAGSSATTRSKATWSSSGKRSMPSSTPLTR